MGAVLEQYLSTFGMTLQQLAAPAQQPPPGGAQTFPTEGPGAMPTAGLSFEQEPSGGMDAAGMPVGQTFDVGSQVQTAPAPSFEGQPGPAEVMPVGGGGPAEALPLLPFDEEQPVEQDRLAFPEEEVTQPTPEVEQPPLPPGTEGIAPDEKPKEGMKPEDVKSVDDLFAAASNEDIDKGVEVIEGQLEEQGSSLDEAYGSVTGGPPDTRLTKREKGQLLMEFGLRMLAYSGQEGAEFEAIGRAGIETMGSARAIRAGKTESARTAEQDALATRVKEAQIAKDKASTVELLANKNGEMVAYDKATGTSKPILGADGNPLTAESDLKKFESEMNREAYRQYFIDTTGECDSSCERGALAYSKGGASEVAFPELMYANQTDRVMKILEDSDNASAKYPVPGTDRTKRWKDMNAQEKEDVATGMVDRRMRVMEAGGVRSPKGKTKAPAPDGWKNFESIGMDEETARKIEPGRRMKHPKGGYIENVDGVLKHTDESGKPWAEPEA